MADQLVMNSHPHPSDPCTIAVGVGADCKFIKAKDRGELAACHNCGMCVGEGQEQEVVVHMSPLHVSCQHIQYYMHVGLHITMI